MLYKYLFLFWFGGSTYVTLEVFWRGYSHWTMFLLAGFLFVIIGLLNEVFEWSTNLILQIFVASSIAIFLEFITGVVVNIIFKLNIWDYSNLPFNLFGQVCLSYSFLWIFLSFIAIVLDDYIRWKFFDEEKPVYRI